MATFIPHTLETVAPEGLEALQQVQENYGFIPNLIGNLAEAPATLKGYLALGGLLGETTFSAAEQQVIMLAVSRFNECGYCVGAHSAIALMQKVPADVVESIRNDTPIADAKLEALRRFTTLVVEKRGWLAERDTGEFLAAGFTRQQILEVVLGIAMKTISNYANHIAGTELDDAFAAQAWAPEAPEQGKSEVY